MPLGICVTGSPTSVKSHREHVLFLEVYESVRANLLKNNKEFILLYRVLKIIQPCSYGD